MASIRKRRDKWQVQVRRQGQRSITQSFYHRRDAETWARQMEVQADKGELPKRENKQTLSRIMLGQLVERYSREISPGKRGGDRERIVLKAFLRHPICKRSLAELTTKAFANYRDERLKDIKPSTLNRQRASIHNLFEVAREEWGFHSMTTHWPRSGWTNPHLNVSDA